MATLMAVASLLLFASAVTASSPTAKVVKLLEDLEAEAKKEQTAEKGSFKEYSAWCTKSIDSKKKAIASGVDEAEKGSALIEKKTSAAEDQQKTLKEQTSTKEALEAEKLANKRQCEKDKSTYEAAKADHDSAVEGLKGAIAKMAEGAGSKSSSLLQFGSELQQSLDLAEALGFLNEPKHQAMVAFLQGGKPEWLEKDGEQYNQTDYSFQSGGIVQTLKDLLTQFTTEREALESNWKKTSDACDSTESAKKKVIGETETAIASTTTLYQKTKGELAKAKDTLQKTKKTLKDDRDLLSDLQEDCDARASDFAQRSKNRAGEIEAIGAALKVMKDQVGDVASVLTKSSLLSTDADVEVAPEDSVPSFFQQMSHRDIHNHAVTQSNTAEAERSKVAIAEAVSLLSKAGSDLNSLRLSGLAFRMQATPSAGSDPLKFVKDMAQKMVNDLEVDRTAYTTKKGLCDTQMMKASKERDRRFRESMSLDKKMKALDITRKELIEKIGLQSSSITKMEKELNTATKLRANESSQNLATIRDAKKGFEAVADAIVTLENFYKKAARNANMYDEAAAFLQQGSTSSREEADPSAGFEGSYAGKQDKALGIVTMLETIRDDFKKTAEDTQTEETDAADKFTKLKSKTKVDIASKKTSKTMNKEDLEATINDLSAAKDSLTTTVQLMDTALETLTDLKEECDKAKLTYDQSTLKRRDQIAMLKQALCILDTHHTQAGCDTTTTTAAR